MLGIDPDRDREIEVVNTLIENCAAVGIPAVKYNMNLIGIPRSEREPGSWEVLVTPLCDSTRLN